MKKTKTSKKGRFKVVKYILLAIVVILIIGGSIGWSSISKEHREARSLPIEAIDFNSLADGTYTGSYAGGMYKWRTNKVQVTVSSGRVTEITLLDAAAGPEVAELYERIKSSQSLQVDTVSGATLTCNAYLKGVELALVQGER